MYLAVTICNVYESRLNVAHSPSCLEVCATPVGKQGFYFRQHYKTTFHLIKTSYYLWNAVDRYTILFIWLNTTLSQTPVLQLQPQRPWWHHQQTHLSPTACMFQVASPMEMWSPLPPPRPWQISSCSWKSTLLQWVKSRQSAYYILHLKMGAHCPKDQKLETLLMFFVNVDIVWQHDQFCQPH